MRTHFQDKLAEIRSDVIRMAGDVNEMVRLATEATLSGDSELAQRVVSRDDVVDSLENQILHSTVMVVMLEAPVAADLRLLVSTLGIVGEIEKAGDHAVKLSRRTIKLRGSFPSDLRLALQDLSDSSRKTFNSALRLYSEYDAELASQIIASDEIVDSAYKAVRDRILGKMRETPSDVSTLSRTLEIFHALEHVADCGVAIADRLRTHYEAGSAIHSSGS